MTLAPAHTLAEGLVQVLTEWIRYALHTAVPGIVESYNPATRRARVRFALEAVMDNRECVEKAPAVDVPVLMPIGGAGGLHLSLSKGDNVWLMFSERGLENWKRKFERSEPFPARMFSEADAVALPGFGPGSGFLPATNEGVSVQTTDGSTSVVVSGNTVTITVPEGGQVNIGGAGGKRLLTEDFLASFNDHTHGTRVLNMLNNGPTDGVVAGDRVLASGSNVTQKARGV